MSVTFESLIQVGSRVLATNWEDAGGKPIRDHALETALVTPSVQSGYLCSQKFLRNQ